MANAILPSVLGKETLDAVQLGQLLAKTLDETYEAAHRSVAVANALKLSREPSTYQEGIDFVHQHLEQLFYYKGQSRWIQSIYAKLVKLECHGAYFTSFTEAALTIGDKVYCELENNQYLKPSQCWRKIRECFAETCPDTKELIAAVDKEYLAVEVHLQTQLRNDPIKVAVPTGSQSAIHREEPNQPAQKGSRGRPKDPQKDKHADLVKTLREQTPVISWKKCAEKLNTKFKLAGEFRYSESKVRSLFRNKHGDKAISKKRA